MNQIAGPRTVPLELLEGFARVWVELQGGSYRKVEVAGGTLLVWTAADGQEMSLPDRMYGLADYASHDFIGELPAGTLVNLPPGVRSVDGKVVCETHLMRASTTDAAWGCLKRVGRQGVRKAEKSGCRLERLDLVDYLDLSVAKNERMGSPEPSERLPQVLVEVFGAEHVQSTGVMYEGKPVAAVLWVVIQGYGLLIDGASHAEHWDKNPNNLAVWGAVEELISRDADVVDFGFSPVGSGDARFKRHMGGACVPLFQVLR